MLFMCGVFWFERLCRVRMTEEKRKEKKRRRKKQIREHTDTHETSIWFWHARKAAAAFTIRMCSLFVWSRDLPFSLIVHKFQFLFWFFTQLLSRWTSLPIIFRTTRMLLSAICPLSPSHTLSILLSLTRSKASIVDECFTCCIYNTHVGLLSGERTCENVCCGSRFINCKAPTDLESPLHTNSRSHHIYECINHFVSLGMPMRAFCTIISTHVHTAHSVRFQFPIGSFDECFQVNCHVWSWIYSNWIINFDWIFMCARMAISRLASYFQAIEMG